MKTIEGDIITIDRRAELRSSVKDYIRLCVLERKADEEGNEAMANLYYSARKGKIFKYAVFARHCIEQDESMSKQWDNHLKTLFFELLDFTVYEADEWLLACTKDGSIEIIS